MVTALVAIAKMEDKYIEEWLEYNHKIGFDHIYLYMNDWTTDIERDWLTKIQWNGSVRQMAAYNTWLKTYKHLYDYVAFFDCDEYLCLKKHNNISDFLTEYGNPNGIAVNWVMFGALCKLTSNSNSLLKEYIYRAGYPDRHIKTILNCKAVCEMSLPHNPTIKLFDTNHKSIMGPWSDKGPIDVVQLNHYYPKSLEDWKLRCERGRADWTTRNKIEEWQDKKEINCEVEDTIARDFFYGNPNED